MNKTKFLSLVLTLVLFLVLFSINTFAENRCSIDHTGYNCSQGAIQSLQTNNDCLIGRVCNNNQDYCCGSSNNLWCCRPKTSQTTQPQASTNFLNVRDSTSSVQEIISKYIGLSIQPENVGYKQLKERSMDQATGIQALYEEATGYKQLAILRREYNVIPSDVLRQQSAGSIVGAAIGTGAGRVATANVVAAAPAPQAQPAPAAPQPQESFGAFEQRVDRLIIRSNIIMSRDSGGRTSTGRIVGSFKYFDGSWYWSDGEDNPETRVSRVNRNGNDVERLAFSLNGTSFSQGIKKLTDFATQREHEIVIKNEDGTTNAFGDPFDNSTLKEIINGGTKTTKTDYSSTRKSYPLEIYDGKRSLPFMIKEVVYFIYDGGWKYKVKEDNEYSARGDVLPRGGLLLNENFPDSWYEELLQAMSAEDGNGDGVDYAEGVRAISKKANKNRSYFNNPSVIIKSRDGDVELPKDGEDHVSKDELGTYASAD